jgi:hypothetical protein
LKERLQMNDILDSFFAKVPQGSTIYNLHTPSCWQTQEEFPMPTSMMTLIYGGEVKMPIELDLEPIASDT